MNDPKVYLLYVPDQDSGDHENLIFPNGLYYIYANLLENEIESDMFMMFRSNINELLSILKGGEIIGLSVNSSNLRDSLVVARELRGFSDRDQLGITIVMGGPFISLIDDRSLERIEYVDVFFKNESEYSFVEFVKEYSKGRNKKRIICSERIRKLDEMIIPAKKGLIYSNIMTSRGCPGRCTFCSSKLLWKRRVYFRSAESVYKEMKMLYDSGVDYFVFSDDTFTMKKTRLVKLFKMIEDSSMKIIFDFRSRADYMDEEMIRILARAGAVSVSLGIESADEKVLDILKKDIDLKKAQQAVRLCKKYGIRTNLFFIVGCVGEDEGSIDKNIEFINNTDPDWITVYGLHFFPGTELSEDHLKQHDWIAHHSTVYYEDLDIIDKRKARMIDSFNKKRREKSDVLPEDVYRSMFWKFDELANLANDKKRSVEYLKKSLELYPSPEVMYKLADLTDDKKLMSEAVDKFIFQRENDIRKDLSFLKNCALVFQENGLSELLEETLMEIDFLEMNRKD